MRRTGRVAVAAAAVLAATAAAAPVSAGDRSGPDIVHPALRSSLVAHYDFDHPLRGDPALEQDQGRSSTEIELVNGGAAMRVADRAYPGGGRVLQTRPVNPGVTGNDDWKAGIYSASGVRTLRPFSNAEGATVMGWFKRSMDGPAAGFNAIGLAGVLTGDSDGHAVRALLELIDVNGELKLVALGRRIDGGNSQTFAATEDWRTLLPKDKWVHLTATFDFTQGTMALYRDGRAVPGSYTRTDDPWLINGPGPHVTSAADARGIKIGGSFPQNTLERNPCDCRMDALMFLDRSLSPREVTNQFRRF